MGMHPALMLDHTSLVHAFDDGARPWTNSSLPIPLRERWPRAPPTPAPGTARATAHALAGLPEPGALLAL